MISLETMIIRNMGPEVKVSGLEVWFHTQDYGMVRGRDALVELAQSLNVSIRELNASAVPVAVGEDGTSWEPI